MNKQMMEAFMAWGTRANRDTAHLMDIVVAGTIDQLQGHGSVILRPARLEEIVSRIAKREQDADGGWKVTLHPEAIGTTPDPKAIRSEETSAEVASIAGRIMAGGNPLDNEQVLEAIYQHIGASTSRTELRAGLKNILDVYFENMLSLAGSALTQYDPRDDLEPYHNPDGN